MAGIKKCKTCKHYSKPDAYELEEEEGLCSLLSFASFKHEVEATVVAPSKPNVLTVLIVEDTFNCKHYERNSS